MTDDIAKEILDIVQKDADYVRGKIKACPRQVRYFVAPELEAMARFWQMKGEIADMLNETKEEQNIVRVNVLLDRMRDKELEK